MAIYLEDLSHDVPGDTAWSINGVLGQYRLGALEAIRALQPLIVRLSPQSFRGF